MLLTLLYPQTLKSDEGAHFDRIVKISSSDIAPTVTWGTSPEDTAPITGNVPRPEDAASDEKRGQIERALKYMGLEAGMKLEDVKITNVSPMIPLLLVAVSLRLTATGLHRILHQLAYRGSPRRRHHRQRPQGRRGRLRHDRSRFGSRKVAGRV